MHNVFLTHTEDTVLHTVNIIPRSTKHPPKLTERMKWTLALTPPVLFPVEPHPGGEACMYIYYDFLWYGSVFSRSEAYFLMLSCA